MTQYTNPYSVLGLTPSANFQQVPYTVQCNERKEKKVFLFFVLQYLIDMGNSISLLVRWNIDDFLCKNAG